MNIILITYARGQPGKMETFTQCRVISDINSGIFLDPIVVSEQQG
jgi:hypothetical protein